MQRLPRRKIKRRLNSELFQPQRRHLSWFRTQSARSRSDCAGVWEWVWGSGRTPGNNLAPIEQIHGVGVLSDEYHWVKMNPDCFMPPSCPEYTQHILLLMPRNLGLPCCILFQWTTWKFGESFYSHYKTYKQFKQITAIFKWMSAMLKIRTVIFMNRPVDCPALPLHPSASVLANLRKISDSSLPEYFTSQELLKERMFKMSCKSLVACL